MLQPRGRSRQVSNTALARHASEERRSAQPNILTPIPVKAACPPSFMHSASSSPPSSASMSPDCYDLLASPPPSLEDQVHVAYALDDIHLAKILLLRLKGIEVASDDDPRIAAVQDEDFDFCFVPNGRLMDDRDEKAIKEMQTKELERLDERRRFERLRICEKIWDDQKRRLREERLAVFRQRERKWMEEEDRRRSVEQRHEERHRIQKAALAEKAVQRTRARLVCYDNLPTTPEKRLGDQFVYDFMIHSPPSRLPNTPSLSYSRPHLRGPIFDDSRSIPFSAVLDSMQGPLFPISAEELYNSPSTSRSTSRTRSPAGRRRKCELLETLLVEIQWPEDDRRNRKGKEKALLRRSLPCLACSFASSRLSPAPSTTSSSSSVSRTSSWLSFAGSSPSTTDSLTPPTSPAPSFSSSKSGWFKSSLPPRPKSWITTSNLLNLRNSSLRHSCNPHCRFTPVPSSESPLPLNATHSAPMSYDGRRRSTGTVRAAKEVSGLLVRVSRFMEIAKEFQQSYVNLALSPERGSRETGSREKSSCRDVPGSNSGMHNGRLREPGYRVSQCDVTAFLNVSSSEAGSSPEASPGLDATTASTSQDTPLPPPPRYIPLRPPPSSDPPRTVLPEQLPYRRVFKPLPMPIRSPFRCHALSELHTTYPSVSDPSSLLSSSYNRFLHHGPLTWRIRSVENPVYLRLKALHNVIWRRGMVWQGRGRDTALGGGRERVVGVAYDGVGRSSLSCEVKF